jgi:hypothetical protein
MSPDLHPEELLDKSAAGTLSESETQWLNQHLASCSSCRFEQKARADFSLAPSASLDVDNLVARALAGMPTQVPAQGFGAPRKRFPLFIAAAVAMFTMASFGAVGSATGMLPQWVEHLLKPAPISVPEVAPGVPAATKQLAVPRPVEAAPEPVVLMSEPEEAVTVAIPAPAAVVAPTPVLKHAFFAAPVVAAPEDSAVLFTRGNAARIRSDRAEAAMAYRALLARFPDSAEARLTHAVLGRMLLDSGDASGALQELDTYLTGSDATLREEAMAARAMALSALGRTTDETAAWTALVNNYPSSVYATRARARLEDLSQP